MASIAGAITLYDLIAWEPGIRASGHERDLIAREIDWVITARTSQPMLPRLRGGELIILPESLVRELGVPLSQLVHEISSQPIAGVLTDAVLPDEPTEVPVLSMAHLSRDTEAELNRMISNGRREAQNEIARLDQSIADAAARQSRPGELVERLSRQLQLPITIHTGGGTVLFTTATSNNEPDPTSPAWLNTELRQGYTLWLGPISPTRHAIARFATDHVREAIERSLDSTAIAAPRGTARTAALNRLILEPASKPQRLTQQALEADVPPDATLRVARSLRVPAATVRLALGHLGDVLDAGTDGDQEIWLLVSGGKNRQPPRSVQIEVGWIALSGKAAGISDLALAARQARYIATAIDRNLLPTGLVEFGPNIGVLELLFDGWEQPLQLQFRDEHLHQLLANDPRGLLLDTIEAFLRHHGAHAPTAETLGIHRNTLSYRLRQIDSILPLDLDDASTRLTLQIAIIIHRMITL